ncbi:MAG: hypothetical protein WD623_02355 [Marinobacter sp.]|uniref:hypothetical protein n=1 Tax=Marinobacter sp. TaxID=50741 RepID=UPI0034A07127
MHYRQKPLCCRYRSALILVGNRRVLFLVAYLIFNSSHVNASNALPLAANASEPQQFLLWHRNFDSPAVKALVELALEKTPEYGPYTILRSPEMGQGRAVKELANNNQRVISLANVASSVDREEQLLAIPIPIDGGLLGFRVCVVRAEDKELFSDVRRVADLSDQNLRIGQGTHWPDTGILRASGIEVVDHPRFDVLFAMLKRQRFDCFARGINEVLHDLDTLQDAGMVVEPYLLLGYPMPSYFFAGPDDHETAQRIQLGMERAIRDGSFSDYLETYYVVAMEHLRLNERTVLMLDNPYLSEDSSPIARRALESLRQRIEGPLHADN